MKALGIAGVNLRRLFRDRSNIFFVLIFPIALVLLIGTAFGGDFAPRLGVVAPASDEDAADIVGALNEDDALDVVEYDDDDELLAAVERGEVSAGVVIPDGYGEDLANGDQPTVGFIARPDGIGPQLQSSVQAVIGPQAARIRAARFASEHAGIDFSEAIERATELQPQVPEVTVETTDVGEALFPETLGRFDLGASSQLLLFMFVTGLSAAAALIQTRRLGVSRRMLSTPTSVGTIVTGEALGRVAVVLFQGLYIIIATRVIFGVDWGDPVGALAITLLFALVTAGIAMLIGAVFRNDQQAAGISVVIGLGISALGGTMAPLDLFSPTLRRIAHLTPHAWAFDGFAELVRRGGTVADILPELAVLAAMAGIYMAIATWRLRVALTEV